MRCYNCGEDIDEGSKSCVYCGAAVDEEVHSRRAARAANEDRMKRRKKKKIKKIVSLCAVIAAIIAAVALAIWLIVALIGSNKTPTIPDDNKPAVEATTNTAQKSVEDYIIEAYPDATNIFVSNVSEYRNGETGYTELFAQYETVLKDISITALAKVDVAFDAIISGKAESLNAGCVCVLASGNWTTIALVKNQNLNAFIISYDANGGTGAPEQQTKASGETLVLSSIVPVKTGFVFSGWSETGDAETALYQAGSPYTSDTSVTLYAVWTAGTVVEGYITVTYDANGGTGAPAQQNKTAGVALTLSETVPTKEGSAFVGWSTVKNGSVEYAAGATYSKNEAVTLYAVWAESVLHLTDGVSGTFNGTLWNYYDTEVDNSTNKYYTFEFRTSGTVTANGALFACFKTDGQSGIAIYFNDKGQLVTYTKYTDEPVTGTGSYTFLPNSLYKVTVTFEYGETRKVTYKILKDGETVSEQTVMGKYAQMLFGQSLTVCGIGAAATSLPEGLTLTTPDIYLISVDLNGAGYGGEHNFAVSFADSSAGTKKFTSGGLTLTVSGGNGTEEYSG